MTQGNLYGAGPMSDTLDFVKKLWGGMSVPGMPAMVAPTLSIEELEQKITDLKAVESWLSVNMNMLRNTIQAMEVQRATIGTLQSMSAAFQSAVSSGAEEKIDASAFWSALQTEKASPAAASAAKPEPDSAPPAPKATVSAPADLATQMASPAAWWDVLQNQFKQAVSNAIAEPEPKAANATAARSAATTTKTQAAPRKPAIKSAAKPAAAKSAPAARKRKPAPKA